MIKSKYNSSTKSLEVWNYSPTPLKCDFILVDLDTNLGFFQGWVELPPNQGHCNIFNFSEDPMHSKILELGFELKVYSKFNNELIHQNQFSLSDSLPKNYFYGDGKVSGYGPWYDLEYLKGYDSFFNVLPTDVIYDLGGSIGVFSKWVDKHFNYDHIYVFEPNPLPIEGMKKTFKDKFINVFQKAISNKNSFVPFYLFNRYMANSIAGNNVSAENPNFLDIIKVESINLESFVNKENLKLPTILKVDIEGEEYNLIESLSSSFFSSIRLIIFEFHYNDNNKILNVINKLTSLGFNFDFKDNTKIEDYQGTIIFTKT